MKNYSTENIINLALTGHATTGKTVLAEAMISNAGMIHEMGSIKEGTTISDYREYEIKNQHSISLTLMNLEWQGKKINISNNFFTYIDSEQKYKYIRGFEIPLRYEEYMFEFKNDSLIAVYRGRNNYKREIDYSKY